MDECWCFEQLSLLLFLTGRFEHEHSLLPSIGLDVDMMLSDETHLDALLGYLTSRHSLFLSRLDEGLIVHDVLADSAWLAHLVGGSTLGALRHFY